MSRLRIDRLIALGLVRPFLRTFCRPVHSSHHCLPILMYHSISNDPESGVRPYYRTATSPHRFAEQMGFLKDHGWQGVTLSEGLAWLANPKEQKASRVVLTFDDGFRDFFSSAVPILESHGFRATMYLATDYISDSNANKFRGKECLTWSETEILSRDGFEFGSHTVTHPKLVDLSLPDVERELKTSKCAIEQHLGVPVPHFAYPYAFPHANSEFIRRFREILGSTGYTTNVTTEIGREAGRGDLLRLKRLPMNEADDQTLLAAKLEGAYDWLALPQKTMKILKAFGRRPPGETPKPMDN